MKPVAQKHYLGCGAACVAFLVNKSYSEVVDYLGEAKAKEKGFYCRDLVEVLLKFNHTYSHKYLKSRLKRKIYSNGVIVFIQRSNKYPSGHYVVYFNSQWMDPWINFLQNKNINVAEAGFRKRLPGTPIYALFPQRNKF